MKLSEVKYQPEWVKPCWLVAINQTLGTPEEKIKKLAIKNGWDGESEGATVNTTIQIVWDLIGKMPDLSLTKESRGKTARDFSGTTNETGLVFTKAHVMPMVNGRLSNFNGHGEEPIVAVATYSKQVNESNESVVSFEKNNLTTLRGLTRGEEKIQILKLSNNKLKSLEGCPEVSIKLVVDHNELISLKGAPKHLETFQVDGNSLTSLVGGPELVTKNYWCNDNQLTTLEGAPHSVGTFRCDRNKLTTLEHSPEVCTGQFTATDNKLTSLKGAPREVKLMNVSFNQLTSLEGAPEIVHTPFSCEHNKLKNLKNIHKIFSKIGGTFNANNNPIESHVLGLLLISELKRVMLGGSGPLLRVEEIINKYLPNTRGMEAVFDCQEELMAANLEAYAQV